MPTISRDFLTAIFPAKRRHKVRAASTTNDRCDSLWLTLLTSSSVFLPMAYCSYAPFLLRAL